MALNSEAVFTAAKGYVFVGEVGTAVKPTGADVRDFDGDTLDLVGWTDLGHTDREDLPEFGFEGGDVETRGTWRNQVLREVITEAATDYVIVTLSQFDDEAFTLYYGVENSADPVTEAGEFVVMDTASATVEKAFLIIIEDGKERIAFYSPKASVRREDSIELAVDEFGKMPVRASFLKEAGQPLFAWIPGADPVESP